MHYVAPDGREVLAILIDGDRAIIHIAPGVTVDVERGKYIVYPKDGGLPTVVDSLDGYQEVA